MVRRSAFVLGLLFLLCAVAGGPGTRPSAAQAQQNCPGGLRKINVGISVSPPNVVHTPPYVAKALGYFAKHCVDANIVEFNGGTVGTIVAAISQGNTIANLTDISIGRGLNAKQIWMFAPHPPQAYVVGPDIKTAKDLKGKRLSAAGGGVGGFNWLMGREVLKTAGLKVDDAQFIAGDTAGRLPGLVAGQVDAVVLHPEDVYLALKQRPGAHVLVQLGKLMPNFTFTAYGASDGFIARDPALLRDTVAAMIEAVRTMYRDPKRVIPIIMDATHKPRDAVQFAYDQITQNCVWAVNTGFNPASTLWTEQHDIDDGDIDATKHLSFDQIVDMKLAREALAEAGGPTTIGKCKE
jgi:ABC-type nitrate/sulfonate/bicarbonate transport system substrate-binding protein